jgi:hypothetical protein
MYMVNCSKFSGGKKVILRCDDTSPEKVVHFACYS